jgi:hypothetical protein
MTAKEQAFHLVFEFERDIIGNNKKAKECALKVVRHLIAECDSERVFERIYFWNEVKQEIEKL